jgi:hypothetical protein
MRVAIVCAFLVAALAAVAVSHQSTHAAPAKKGAPAAKIVVNPSTVMLLTSGGFSTTVYGQGLASNTYYKLFDNNTLCEDSINTNSPNVLTDLNGHFAFTLSAVLNSSGPCLAGSFKVSAIGASSSGAKAKALTANVTLAHSQVLPISASVTPKLVISLVDGSFATTVNITGLKPATTYAISDDTPTCQTSYNSGLTLFATDSEGNAELVLHGGPDYYGSSAPCSPGTYTESINDTPTHVVVKTSWVLEPAQP